MKIKSVLVGEKECSFTHLKEKFNNLHEALLANERNLIRAVFKDLTKTGSPKALDALLNQTLIRGAQNGVMHASCLDCMKWYKNKFEEASFSFFIDDFNSKIKKISGLRNRLAHLEPNDEFLNALNDSSSVEEALNWIPSEPDSFFGYIYCPTTGKRQKNWVKQEELLACCDILFRLHKAVNVFRKMIEEKSYDIDKLLFAFNINQ